MTKYVDSFLSHCKEGLSAHLVNLTSYLLIHSINLSSLRVILLVITIVYFYQMSIPT